MRIVRKRSLLGMKGIGGRDSVPWYMLDGAKPVAIYQPAGAASLASSYTNLVNPSTYTITAGSAPDWDAVNGWKFNGSSNHLETGLTPGNTWSAICRYSNLPSDAATRVLFGVRNGSAYFEIYTYLTYIGYSNRMSSPTTLSRKPPTAGVFALSPGKLYYNGENYTNVTQTDITTGPISIGGLYRVGVGYSGYHSAYIQAIAFYNEVLSDDQIRKMSRALNQSFAPVTTFLPYGDSKTENEGWQKPLELEKPHWVENPFRIAVAGRSVFTSVASLIADLEAAKGTPDYVLWNFGVNDGNITSIAESWKSNIAIMWDSIKAKWPKVIIYAANAWSTRDTMSVYNFQASCINEVMAPRASWVRPGPDERVWLENGDNGATYTLDGIHYNSAGMTENKNQWLSILP